MMYFCWINWRSVSLEVQAQMGLLIGINMWRKCWTTVNHVHIHLIPRNNKGDVEDPSVEWEDVYYCKRRNIVIEGMFFWNRKPFKLIKRMVVQMVGSSFEQDDFLGFRNLAFLFRLWNFEQATIHLSKGDVVKYAFGEIHILRARQSTWRLRVSQ